MQYLGETFLFPVIDGKSLASTSTGFQFFYPCNGATLAVNASGGGPCDGPTAPVAAAANLSLATLLGADTSGTDPTFALPDLTSPAAGVDWFISNTGPMPTGRAADDAMPIVGQISLYPVLSGGQQYDPSELVPCDGRMYSVGGNPTLFSLLGATFGGDGQQSFAMPNVPSPGPSLFFGMCTSGVVPQLVPFAQEAPK